MQVAEEKKNIVIDDADIPAGLDRLDLILEADAKRNLKRDDTKERLDNIDAMIAYILNVLDDLDYDDPDPLAAEALGDEDIDDPLADGHPDFEDPDAVADVHVPDHLNDDPHADIDIPPPGEDDPDIPEGLVNVEHWRIIDDFPDYEVSNHGRVRDALSRTIREPTRSTPMATRSLGSDVAWSTFIGSLPRPGFQIRRISHRSTTATVTRKTTSWGTYVGPHAPRICRIAGCSGITLLVTRASLVPGVADSELVSLRTNNISTLVSSTLRKKPLLHTEQPR